jgi:hypothetical protein
MLGLGLACNQEDLRLVVRGVVLEESPKGDVSHSFFDCFTDAQAPLEQQMADLLDAIRGRLHDVEADFVVIRAMDVHPNPKFSQKTTVVQAHSRVDGILMALSFRKFSRTKYLTGNQIGQTCGSLKKPLEDKAGKQFGKDFKEAGGAAFAALALAKGSASPP